MLENALFAFYVSVSAFFTLVIYSEVRKLTVLARDLMFQIDAVTDKIRAIQNNLKNHANNRD